MRLTLILLALLAGCTRTPQPTEFVQGDVRITPSVQRLSSAALEDGGSVVATVRDAKGRTFSVFIDYRLRTKSPGAVYLNGEPGTPGSLLVTNGTALREMFGL